MPNRRLELSLKYHTAPSIQKELGLSRFQLDIRIERSILPPPTLVDGAGVRYFDEDWLKRARVILKIE